MRTLRTLATVLATTTAAAGCIGDDTALDPPEPHTSDQQQALSGIEGTFEWAIDAPWRLDPQRDPTTGELSYPPIPVQVSFFDEYLADRDTSGRRLGEFCNLNVKELVNGVEKNIGTYGWGVVADSERLGMASNHTGTPNWPFPDDTAALPTRTVCQPNNGTACTLGRRIFESSEWNARVDVPLVRTAGTRAILKLEAKVSKHVGGCSTTNYPDASERLAFTNWVMVEYGRAPLPTFGDDRWLYSDLHYHSQGTDNEGEVGYNYRGTLAASSAIGIDVIVATDHASDGKQIVDVDLALDTDISEIKTDGARDMTPRRFATARDVWLEGTGGVNPAAATIWPHMAGAPSQIFLGGEVDVAPVVDAMPTTPHDFDIVLGQPVAVETPADEWYIHYGNPHHDGGNGLRFDMHSLCTSWSDWLSLGQSCPGSGPGDIDEMFTPFVREDGTTGYQVHDVQGANETEFLGRQHLLYVPRSKSIPDSFVGSRTSTFGGATRDLTNGADALADDVQLKNGIAFMAHPLDGSNGGRGPGMVPFTETQLHAAFQHPVIAGLQLWNENVRLEASDPGCNPGLGAQQYAACLAANDWRATGYDLIGNDLFDLNGDGHAEGYDAGSFLDIPVFDKETWQWQRTSNDLDYKLHHGAYTWDQMLRMGLDRSETQQLSWLPPGEVRKLFMAGGSDAHGDFNYRRTGYMVEFGSTNNDALGAVRNLVLAGSDDGTAVAQDAFVDALAEGRFSVTDGPALRIAIDRNRNGVYDDDDLPMGSTVYVDASELDNLPLVVDWESSVDFGPVSRVDLYVGVGNEDSTASGNRPMRTYAPVGHGVRREAAELEPDQIANGIVADPLANDCGSGICEMADGYFLPASAARDQLRIVPSGDAMTGMRAVTLDLGQFPTSQGAATRVYIRAFAETTPSPALGLGCFAPTIEPQYEQAVLRGECIHRYAFTNPVWAVSRNFQGVDCPYEPNSLDQDLDGYPDLCDGDPLVPSRGGWSRQAGGTNADTTSAVVQDSTGAVIAGGRFIGTIEIDGAGTLTPPNSVRDGYVVKYDDEGHAEWLMQLSGTGDISVTDLAVEPSTDDVLVTGTFTGQLAVPGKPALTASSEDSFIVKIDGDTGAALWQVALTGLGNQRVLAAVFDSFGRVVVTGSYKNEVKIGTTVRLTGDTTEDALVVFLSTSTGGYINARKLAGTGNAKGNDLAAGPGRLYVIGEFTGQLVPDPLNNPTVTRSDSSGTDGFVIAYDLAPPSIIYAWDLYVGGMGSSLQGDAWLTAAAVDSSGQLLVGGQVKGVLKAGNGGLLWFVDGNKDVVLLRFDATGARTGFTHFGGDADDTVTDLDVSGAGIAVVGLFQSHPMHIGPFDVSTPGPDYDGFATVVRGSDLTPLWAGEFAWQGPSYFTAVDIDDGGVLALSGEFGYWYKLDQAHQMLSRGVNDGFIGRISPLP